MSRRSYAFRALLYIALAVLPAVRDGVEHHTAPVLMALTAAYEAALALRAYIDKSTTAGEEEAPANADAIASAAATGGAVSAPAA